MKKFMYIPVLIFIILLSGCSTNQDKIVNNLEGEYYYKECIYLAPWSSSTLDFYPNLYGSLLYVEFSNGQISYYGNDEVIKIYNQVEFREEEVNKDLDSVINLDFDGVFELFEYRYDMYNDGISVNLTIFVKGDTLYLAETKMTGGNHDIFAVWSIVEIEKQS